ncbi:MAG: SRPBCC domain-containing protein [Xanthomonadales bacterium]|nr:SRPBCC domain-containing protein [Xanthomonadales bacterium]
MKKYLLLLLVLSINAGADVISSGANGFQIKIERTAAVDVQTAYGQFLNVGDWWNADHTWFGDASGLYIEPYVGGCFCEKSADKQALHMTVSYIDPGNEIRMVGGLGPLQMMGVHGGMSWRFVAVGDKETKIIQHYQVTGFAKDGLASLAPIVDQVQTLQHESLVSLLND